MIEHGAIITTGDTLKLPPLGRGRARRRRLRRPLADAEREHILRALETAGGHIKGPKGAAAALGLKPSTLYSRMKKLGIRLRGQAENELDVEPPDQPPGSIPRARYADPGDGIPSFCPGPGPRLSAAAG